MQYFRPIITATKTMTQLTLACNSIRNLGTLYLGISLFVNVTGSNDQVHFRNRYYHTNRNQRGSNTSPLFDDDPRPIIPGVNLDGSKWSPSVVDSGVHNAISEPSIASIIGGSEVEEGRYPYTVSIRDVYSGDYAYHSCGGSLIAPDIVLTAGHCMEYNAQGLFLSLIAIGMHNISDSSEGELIPIKDIKLHPLYDSAFARNDFAIVVMQRPTSMGVEFVELNQHDNFPSSGQGSVVMGWGITGIDEWWNVTRTDVLMEVELTPIENQECEDILGSHLVHDDMLCAFDGPGKGE